MNSLIIQFHSYPLFYLGPKKSIEIMVGKGADVQHTNRDGYPALIYAAKHGNSL